MTLVDHMLDGAGRRQRSRRVRGPKADDGVFDRAPILIRHHHADIGGARSPAHPELESEQQKTGRGNEAPHERKSTDDLLTNTGRKQSLRN